MKKLFVLLLSGVMITSSVPVHSFAAVKATETPTVINADVAVGNQNEPSTKALEAVIIAVKEKINIPKEYTEFDYYFYDTNSYSESYWNLSWRKPSDGSVIQVNTDADKHITYFYHYDYSNRNNGVAKFLKTELKSKADAFIKKLAPEVANKLEFIDAYYTDVYSNSYTYTYQRVENGVAFPDNIVTVSVNSADGEVRGASVSWLYNAKIPSSSATVTKEQASKLIKENMKMKLVYRSDYYGIYDKNGNFSNKAYLVYEPSLNYISIDAKSGKVYLDRNEWVYGTGGEKATSDTANESKADAPREMLTEQEIAKISELNNLISKPKAIELVTGNKSLYLDKNLTSYSATLTKRDDISGKSSYVWNVNLRDPREVNYEKDKDTYRGNAYATVDAKTGKILSFYASMKGYFDSATNTWKKVTVTYNKEKSKAILETFLKAQINDKFSKSILVNEQDDYVAYYKGETPVYGGYSYQYNRVNEGVEYPYNNIYGSVDGVTGKIYSFGLNWNDAVEFESTKGVISADKAMEYYLSKDGYGLKYEINQINKYNSKQMDSYTVDYEVRLVYRPDVDPAFISPFTGEQLNYNGEVYKKTKPYTYLDITDTKENRNILLLSDMNIGFEGDYFLPTKEITVGELNGLLKSIGYGYYEDSKNSNKENSLILKEELANTIILKMGLEKISQLQGIYTTGFADEQSIDKKYLGAVALAKGYGIIKADVNNYFYPKNKVTRMEAVDIIINFIATAQQNVYYY